MLFVDFRFLGHQRSPPLMTPGGLDPSDTITTIISTINEAQNDVIILKLHCISFVLF